MTRWRLAALTTATLVLVLAGLGVLSLVRWIGRLDLPSLPSPSACGIAGSPYSVSPEQAGNAAIITAVGVARRLPDAAVQIALAAALQESKLVNLDYGDRDSLGLFQQRPSQGWGNSKQIMNPRYSAGRFYQALMKIHGWQRLPAGAVAQRIQQSAFPAAYDRWHDEAVALSSALLGQRPAALSCQFTPTKVAPQPTDSAGLTARASTVLREAGTDLAARRLVSRTDRRTLLLQPATWRAATWLIAQAERLHIRQVGYAGQLWTPAGGWRAATAEQATSARTDRIAVLVS